jgi:hypothetical protein
MIKIDIKEEEEEFITLANTNPGDTFIIKEGGRSKALRLKLDGNRYMNIEEDFSGTFSVMYGTILSDEGALNVGLVDVYVTAKE